jgi:hypothetical protein
MASSVVPAAAAMGLGAYGDALNQSVSEYGPGTVKGANGYYRWAEDGSPVNVRRNNGHSRSARAAASALVAQQIRRNGRPQTQAELQEMYETAQEEVNAELGGSCEVLNAAEFAVIHQILVDASNLQQVPLSGGRRKQVGGARMFEELKRVLRMLCALPVRALGQIDEKKGAELNALGNVIAEQATVDRMAAAITSLPYLVGTGLLAHDLGSNGSFTVRIIVSIIDLLNKNFGAGVIAGWTGMFISNAAVIAGHAALPAAGLAAVYVIKTGSIEAFQYIYNKIRESNPLPAGASSAQAAAYFTGIATHAIAQFIKFLVYYRFYAYISEVRQRDIQRNAGAGGIRQRTPEEIVNEDFVYLPEGMRKDIGNTYNGWLQGFMDRELATYFAAGAAGRAGNVLGRVVEGGRSRRMANKRKVGKRKTEKRKTRKTMKRR